MADRKTKIIKPESSAYDFLLTRVRKVLVEGQKRIESERVRTYWETGRIILAHILKYERAERGKEMIKRLAEDLKVNDTVLNRCVKFARVYPALGKTAAWQQFSWSHYRTLIAVGDEQKRRRLEKTAAEHEWSVGELTARIKEEVPRSEEPPASEPEQSSVDRKLLVPLRGTVHTYRLVERPNLSSNVDSGLLVDLGFGVFHEVDSRLLSAFGKDQIVESRPKDDAYKFYKTDRTAKDLFTYAAFVERVIDGDTLKVRMDLGFSVWIRHTLRLRGIDCPELGTPAGDEARDFVRSHLKEARMITVRSSRSDKYDRYLADLFFPAGETPDPSTDIYLNNLLLETGRAKRMG